MMAIRELEGEGLISPSFIHHFDMSEFSGEEAHAKQGLARVCKALTGESYTGKESEKEKEKHVRACLALLDEAQFHPEQSRVLSQVLKANAAHHSDYANKTSGLSKEELHDFIVKDPVIAPILAVSHPDVPPFLQPE